jgi:hypothetical protein
MLTLRNWRGSTVEVVRFNDDEADKQNAFVVELFGEVGAAERSVCSSAPRRQTVAPLPCTKALGVPTAARVKR